jgi:hypothetical protein
MLTNVYRNICVNSLSMSLASSATHAGANEIENIGHAAYRGAVRISEKIRKTALASRLKKSIQKDWSSAVRRSSWSLILKTTQAVRDKRPRSRKDSWTIK